MVELFTVLSIFAKVCLLRLYEKELKKSFVNILDILKKFRNPERYVHNLCKNQKCTVNSFRKMVFYNTLWLFCEI